MKEVSKKFPSELVNTDLAPHVLPNEAAINMRNIRMHKSADGKAGYFESIMGMLKVSGQTGKIPANSVRVADYWDPAGDFVIWFTHVPGTNYDDQINLYDFKTGQHWIVARSNMTNGFSIERGLNFKIGVFYDLEVYRNILYWTSEDDRPMKIHIGAGIKASEPGVSPDSPFYENWAYDWDPDTLLDRDKDNLSLAVKPPAYPPSISKRYDPAIGANNILADSFQFALQYVYKSREESSLSLFSESSLVNFPQNPDSNVIDVTVDAKEAPYPQGVKEMRLYVIRASTETAFLVKSWTIAEMLATPVLTYSFYGNYYGVALSPSVLSEPYHSVPDLAKTMQMIKYRLMLGHCTEGKAVPGTTSMALVLGAPISVASIASTMVPIQRVMYRGNHKIGGLTRPRFYYSGLFVKLDNVAQPGYYLIPNTEIRYSSGFVGIPAVFVTPPASVAVGALVFKGTNLTEIIENTRTWNINRIYESYIQESATDTITVTGLLGAGDQVGTPVFLHRSDYLAGTAFYDRWLKKCSVVTNSGLRATIPLRNYGLSLAYSDLKYTYDNADAANEIPDWAAYYAPLITRNSRAELLVSSISEAVRYGRIDATTGEYKYDDTDPSPYQTYSSASASIGIDISPLVSAGLGYTFSDGDQCILILADGTTYYLPVLGIDSGKYVRLPVKNLGDLSSAIIAYELYSPYKADEQDYYFEVGKLHAIENPYTDDRKYSVLEGQFTPDAYIVSRGAGVTTAYNTYAMSPNDRYWKRWDNHFGRVNKVLDLGMEVKKGNISYGDVYAPGSGVNGLSAFHATGETNNVPANIGGIVKLQRASKDQGEATVLLAICEAGEASIYIGVAQILDEGGNQVLATSKNVIGQINPLVGGYGCLDPSSVREFEGQVFWYSHLRKLFVRYASNGVYPISEYGFINATRKLAAAINAERTAGKTVVIIGGIDTFHKEYLAQKKSFDAESFGVCEMPTGLTATNSPTGSNPERILMAWDNPGASGVFDWAIYDNAGFLVMSQSGYVPGVDPVSLEILGLIIGVVYHFRLYRRCSAESVSTPAEADLYVDGITPPPGGGCVAPYVDEVVALFNVQAGFPLDSQVEILGSTDFTLEILDKPDWMSITVHGHFVTLAGVPGVGDVGTNIPISFKLTNCAGAGSALTYNTLINVTA